MLETPMLYQQKDVGNVENCENERLNAGKETQYRFSTGVEFKQVMGLNPRLTKC